VEKRDVNIIEELCAPAYVCHMTGAPWPVRGRQALKHLVAAYFAAFDVDDTSEFLIAEGDLVAIHDTYLYWLLDTSVPKRAPIMTLCAPFLRHSCIRQMVIRFPACSFPSWFWNRYAQEPGQPDKEKKGSCSVTTVGALFSLKGCKD
jgi:hypothetical protein